MTLSDRRKPTATPAIMDEALELLPLEGLQPAAEYAMSHGVPRHIAYKVLSAAPENQRSNLSRRKRDDAGAAVDLKQAEAA
nr:hypothetical protein [uncultured Duganella sp.]